MRRGSSIYQAGALAAWTLSATLMGCAALTPIEVDPLREAIVGLSNDVQTVASSLGDVRAQVATIDQSITMNDPWTLRLLAGGSALVLLSYPLGKLVWLLSGRALKKGHP